MRCGYSPPPNRRDHQPARRGAGASAAAGSAAEGVGVAGVGSASLIVSPASAGVAAVAGRGSVKNVTFSRTVERRGVFSLSALWTSAGSAAT
jgi:hypothetical protein